MTNILRKTMITAALAVATIAGTAGTTMITADDAYAGPRPRAGNGAPEARVANPQYQRCAQTVIRFRDQCVANANGNASQINSCKYDYQQGMAGCRRTYL